MSNPLYVRRVKFQDLNEDGTPYAEPTYGIIASDNERIKINAMYLSLEDLNSAIEKAGCILDLVDGFDEADRKKVGINNFYGKDWMSKDTL